MTGFRMLLASSAAAAFLSMSPVSAQQMPTPETPAAPSDPSAGADPCEVVPGGAADAQPPSGDAASPNDRNTSLSETLDRCGGVLSPPAVGDPEMVEPAPDQGETPIIPPSSVPEAQ